MLHLLLIPALAAAEPLPLTAAAAVKAAVQDVRRLEPATAIYTRYITAHHLPPAESPEAFAVASYQVNSLSREAIIVRPRKVTPWLWAIDIRDYGWRIERYGLLLFTPGAIEPYFHVRLLDQKTKPATPAHAPWLPTAEILELAQRTDSSIPLVRFDWFLNRTAIQEGRDGFGYTDFLELRSRADAEKLAGLDRAKAIAIYREQAAVIAESGVALQSRQLFRFGTVAGAWWESRDVKNEPLGGVAERNAVRELLDRYQHDAEEIVFTLPNGLPGFYLSDAAGKAAKSAPPDIASDALSASNDRRVHVGLSCIRCHQAGGLKPFADWARKTYAPGTGLALGVSDDATFRRVRSVYLGPIERAFRRDTEDFGAAIEQASGLKPAALSKAFARQWSRYLDQPVDSARAAAEVGLSEVDYLGRLRRHAVAARLLDPVLAGYLARPQQPVRREHFEELFPLLMGAIGAEP